jgi:hypothetical protein
VRRLRRRGALTTVRPGTYVLGADEQLPDPAARHRLAVLAAVPRLGGGTVISHASAAILHRLPFWFGPEYRYAVGCVHATRDRPTGARRSAHLDLRSAALAPDEVVSVDGVAVTSVARTLADLGRTLPLEYALVPADAALHRRLVTPTEVAEAVRRGAHRVGNGAARRLAAFADGRAESPGESRSRVAISRADLPAPRLQAELGPYRVDSWWPGVVGEFDGRVKYSRGLRLGDEPGDVVFAEKLREDALRATGLIVVRWTWADLDDFAPVAARLRRALHRS